MPQLDSEFWVPQLVWLLVTFSTLYFLMARFALPRIASVLEQRRSRIDYDHDEAQRLEREAEEAMVAYEQALHEARGRAQGLISQQYEDLQLELEAERSRVDAEVSARVRESEERIETLVKESLGLIGAVSTGATALILAKLVGVTLPEDKVAMAVKAEQEGGGWRC